MRAPPTLGLAQFRSVVTMGTAHRSFQLETGKGRHICPPDRSSIHGNCWLVIMPALNSLSLVGRSCRRMTETSAPLDARSGGIVPNRLCDRCSYVLKSDVLWRPSSLSCNTTAKWKSDLYFHSSSLKRLVASLVITGCHLCTQLCKEAGHSPSLNLKISKVRTSFESGESLISEML